MRFDILTLFPEAFESFLKTSIIGKALNKKKIEVNLFNIRDFSTDKHRKVDDIPYGGGAGMVLLCQPLFEAIRFVKKLKRDKAPVVFLTPQGKTLDQLLVETLVGDTKGKRIILLCGHYEGIDQRVRDSLVDLEISIGNFVLTGGELPAQILIDSMARLVPGVLGKKESHEEESFSRTLEGMLEYPHYTRPEEYEGLRVPEVLLSGHHKKIEDWRYSQCRKSLLERKK
ncbi:tRNA (guanosine(37)-N1)-methyltransferase TrmD [Candidatus Gracilibacteria bacterium]|nr:tRNA (guanosine(37)-N1)-methyltransferase TrmD [Candidatus Gracilibacteria bacterium]